MRAAAGVRTVALGARANTALPGVRATAALPGVRATTPALAALAAAAALVTGAVQAQTAERITITGRAAATVAGFGARPLADSPFQGSVFGAEALADAGVTSVAALARLDAAVSDAYNTDGYWSFLSVRGFVLDNRSNYRRDGLPINAETAIGLANKERVELLEGASGIQAGVSAPGGLANLVVKRPTARVREARLEWQQHGGVAARVDLSERFGEAARYGLRVNAEAAELRPAARDADGTRRLLALAGDVQLSADTRIEAEVEWSRQRQPSVPGFSLRGHTLPRASAIDPRVSLNNQPWSLPSVFEGTTASLRWRQRLSDAWRFTAHGATQRLDSDDRIAFPFGCYDAVADVYWADRYCPDGGFDLYDFRSEGERRRVDALDLRLAGRARTASVAHEIAAGVLLTRARDRFGRQAFNYAGPGRDDGSLATDPAPDLTDENTNRDERNTEWYLRDVVELAPAWSLWAGLRHTRLQRESARTDGSRPVDYRQSFTTPWLALAHALDAHTRVYASWGRGIETDVAPNRSRYTNAGQPLPALESEQLELGVKREAAGDSPGWSLAAFSIERPLAVDLGSCDADASCTRAIDGQARHRGLEGRIAWTRGAWDLQGSAMALDAERRGSRDAAVNGLTPTNVPEHALKARVGRRIQAWAGGAGELALVHEGPRRVLADNSLRAPSWTRLDAAVAGRFEAAGARWRWRAGIDNLLDERAWRDTPTQFGHVYLFPLAPRSVRVSLQAAL
jgi:iron complex outermembrane receptor protein